MSDTPEIAAAKRKLELQATELPNWARQLLDYIAALEQHSKSDSCDHYPVGFTDIDTGRSGTLCAKCRSELPERSGSDHPLYVGDELDAMAEEIDATEPHPTSGENG